MLIRKDTSRKQYYHHHYNRNVKNSRNYYVWMTFVIIVIVTTTFLFLLLQKQNKQKLLPIKTTSTSLPIYTEEFLFSRTRSSDNNGWEMWDRTKPLNEHLGLICDWVDFIPLDITKVVENKNNTKATKMCIVAEEEQDIWVSKSIRKNGRWGECDTITALLLQQRRQQQTGQQQQHKPLLYVDIGANIGSCIMQVLLTIPNVYIIAFEPDPGNLFYLTSTLHTLRKELLDRIYLFPIALGDVSSSDQYISVDKTNRGNSIIGNATLAMPSSKFHKPIPIHVERMDSIINNNMKETTTTTKSIIQIDFLKIDAQGYECNIIRGMIPNLLQKHIVQIWYEKDNILLSANTNCNAVILFNMLHENHFNQSKYPPSSSVGNDNNYNNNIADIIGNEVYAKNHRFVL